MAITTTGWLGTGSPGTCSGRISYAAGDVLYRNEQGVPSAGSVFRAVYDFLVARGWSAVTITSNQFPAGKLAMEAPNLLDINGASSKKYLLIDLVSFAGQMLFGVYETIGANGTAGLVNLANPSLANTYGLKVGTTALSGNDYVISAGQDGFILLSASARAVYLHGYCAGSYGVPADQGFIGIAEITRPHAMDTVALGFPKFAFINAYSQAYTAGVLTPVGIPRTRAGSTTNAHCRIITDLGGQAYNSSAGAATILTYGCVAHGMLLEASHLHVRENDYSITTTGLIGTVFDMIILPRYQGPLLGAELMVPLTAFGSVGSPLTVGGTRLTGQKFLDPNGTHEAMWLIGGNYSGSAGLPRILVPK